MTHLNVTRDIAIDAVNYRISVQSYQIYNLIGSGDLITNIVILEGWIVLGCLRGYSSLGDDIPLISKNTDKNYESSRGNFHTEEGRDLAVEYLQQLTEAQLIEAIQRTFNNMANI